MSEELGRQDEDGTRNASSASGDSVRHVAVIGGEAGTSNAPSRWILVIVPVLLIALGGAYLVNLWMAPMLEAPDIRRVKDQRLATPDKAQRPAPTGSSGVDGSDGGFDVQVVLRLLPRADPAAGASVFKMCAACHTDDRDGPHRVGNNLWNIVGSPKAAQPSFTYSQALRRKGGTWSYWELAEYLNNPRTSVPGTSMTFAGIRDNERMANLLAYMRTRADRPVPLPN